MRHKEVHAINTHPSLKFALDFGMSLISEKIKKRVKIYTSLEEAINHKMDTSLLPKEYGGTMPMKEMIGKYIYIYSKMCSSVNNNQEGEERKFGAIID